jgi:hypothetical protein
VTPAERAVIGLAIDHISTSGKAYDELARAVEILLAERATSEPDVSDRTWAEVVEGDEIFSAATQKWYPVIESRRQTEERMAIMAKGLPKILKPLARASVRVRRGASGNAVDTLVSVMISGPRPSWADRSEKEAEAVPAIELDAATDPEASEE